MRSAVEHFLCLMCILFDMHTHGRTNIVIDEKLMEETLAATGLKTKRDAVDLGLRTVLRLCKQGDIRSLRGQIEWIGDLEAMRTHNDPS